MADKEYKVEEPTEKKDDDLEEEIPKFPEQGDKVKINKPKAIEPPKPIKLSAKKANKNPKHVEKTGASDILVRHGAEARRGLKRATKELEKLNQEKIRELAINTAANGPHYKSESEGIDLDKDAKEIEDTRFKISEMKDIASKLTVDPKVGVPDSGKIGEARETSSPVPEKKTTVTYSKKNPDGKIEEVTNKDEKDIDIKDRYNKDLAGTGPIIPDPDPTKLTPERQAQLIGLKDRVRKELVDKQAAINFAVAKKNGKTITEAEARSKAEAVITDDVVNRAIEKKRKKDATFDEEYSKIMGITPGRLNVTKPEDAPKSGAYGRAVKKPDISVTDKDAFKKYLTETYKELPEKVIDSIVAKMGDVSLQMTRTSMNNGAQENSQIINLDAVDELINKRNSQIYTDSDEAKKYLKELLPDYSDDEINIIVKDMIDNRKTVAAIEKDIAKKYSKDHEIRLEERQIEKDAKWQNFKNIAEILGMKAVEHFGDAMEIGMRTTHNLIKAFMSNNVMSAASRAVAAVIISAGDAKKILTDINKAYGVMDPNLIAGTVKGSIVIQEHEKAKNIVKKTIERGNAILEEMGLKEDDINNMTWDQFQEFKSKFDKEFENDYIRLSQLRYRDEQRKKLNRKAKPLSTFSDKAQLMTIEAMMREMNDRSKYAKAEAKEELPIMEQEILDTFINECHPYQFDVNKKAEDYTLNEIEQLLDDFQRSSDDFNYHSAERLGELSLKADWNDEDKAFDRMYKKRQNTYTKEGAAIEKVVDDFIKIESQRQKAIFGMDGRSIYNLKPQELDTLAEEITRPGLNGDTIVSRFHDIKDNTAKSDRTVEEQIFYNTFKDIVPGIEHARNISEKRLRKEEEMKIYKEYDDLNRTQMDNGCWLNDSTFYDKDHYKYWALALGWNADMHNGPNSKLKYCGDLVEIYDKNNKKTGIFLPQQNRAAYLKQLLLKAQEMQSEMRKIESSGQYVLNSYNVTNTADQIRHRMLEKERKFLLGIADSLQDEAKRRQIRFQKWNDMTLPAIDRVNARLQTFDEIGEWRGELKVTTSPRDLIRTEGIITERRRFLEDNPSLKDDEKEQMELLLICDSNYMHNLQVAVYRLNYAKLIENIKYPSEMERFDDTLQLLGLTERAYYPYNRPNEVKYVDLSGKVTINCYYMDLMTDKILEHGYTFAGSNVSAQQAMTELIEFMRVLEDKKKAYNRGGSPGASAGGSTGSSTGPGPTPGPKPGLGGNAGSSTGPGPTPGPNPPPGGNKYEQVIDDMTSKTNGKKHLSDIISRLKGVPQDVADAEADKFYEDNIDELKNWAEFFDDTNIESIIEDYYDYLNSSPKITDPIDRTSSGGNTYTSDEISDAADEIEKLYDQLKPSMSKYKYVKTYLEPDVLDRAMEFFNNAAYQRVTATKKPQPPPKNPNPTPPPNPNAFKSSDDARHALSLVKTQDELDDTKSRMTPSMMVECERELIAAQNKIDNKNKKKKRNEDLEQLIDDIYIRLNNKNTEDDLKRQIYTYMFPSRLHHNSKSGRDSDPYCDNSIFYRQMEAGMISLYMIQDKMEPLFNKIPDLRVSYSNLFIPRVENRTAGFTEIRRIMKDKSLKAQYNLTDDDIDTLGELVVAGSMFRKGVNGVADENGIDWRSDRNYQDIIFQNSKEIIKVMQDLHPLQDRNYDVTKMDPDHPHLPLPDRDVFYDVIDNSLLSDIDMKNYELSNDKNESGKNIRTLFEKIYEDEIRDQNLTSVDSIRDLIVHDVESDIDKSLQYCLNNLASRNSIGSRINNDIIRTMPKNVKIDKVEGYYLRPETTNWANVINSLNKVQNKYDEIQTQIQMHNIPLDQDTQIWLDEIGQTLKEVRRCANSGHNLSMLLFYGYNRGNKDIDVKNLKKKCNELRPQMESINAKYAKMNDDDLTQEYRANVYGTTDENVLEIAMTYLERMSEVMYKIQDYETYKDLYDKNPLDMLSAYKNIERLRDAVKKGIEEEDANGNNLVRRAYDDKFGKDLGVSGKDDPQRPLSLWVDIAKKSGSDRVQTIHSLGFSDKSGPLMDDVEKELDFIIRYCDYIGVSRGDAEKLKNLVRMEFSGRETTEDDDSHAFATGEKKEKPAVRAKKIKDFINGTKISNVLDTTEYKDILLDLGLINVVNNQLNIDACKKFAKSMDNEDIYLDWSSELTQFFKMMFKDVAKQEVESRISNSTYVTSTDADIKDRADEFAAEVSGIHIKGKKHTHMSQIAYDCIVDAIKETMKKQKRKIENKKLPDEVMDRIKLLRKDEEKAKRVYTPGRMLEDILSELMYADEMDLNDLIDKKNPNKKKAFLDKLAQNKRDYNYEIFKQAKLLARGSTPENPKYDKKKIIEMLQNEYNYKVNSAIGVFYSSNVYLMLVNALAESINDDQPIEDIVDSDDLDKLLQTVQKKLFGDLDVDMSVDDRLDVQTFKKFKDKTWDVFKATVRNG